MAKGNPADRLTKARADNKKLRAALLTCREAIRANLVRAAVKDEQLLFTAFKEADAALNHAPIPEEAPHVG